MLSLIRQLVSTLRIQQQANRELEEKMASLGELIADIAHEIQNPLNLVTNFAEVSEELVQDLKSAINAGNSANALILADYLSGNLGRITHHGRRADAIVKSILLQSRKNIGEKQEIDLCALADDCMKLAYQSFKTKNTTCEVQLTKHFDNEPILFACNPQELDRVLINLFTNALYALDKRSKTENSQYQPELTITIRQIKTGIEIVVRDNGTGISVAVQEKIFQPFFTTKPAGQGTGLGLSISYNIIKGLGGELTVASAENEFTAFTIRLPIQKIDEHFK